MTPEIIRHDVFKPYIKSVRTVFALTVWDTGEDNWDGKRYLAYRLKAGGRTIFAGRDFLCSPMVAIDSDDVVKSLMNFLTLRPGDTDAEYFDDYTEEQMDFAHEHGESLWLDERATPSNRAYRWTRWI
jgi:hypothetical protein